MKPYEAACRADTVGCLSPTPLLPSTLFPPTLVPQGGGNSVLALRLDEADVVSVTDNWGNSPDGAFVEEVVDGGGGGAERRVVSVTTREGKLQKWAK